MLKLVEALSKRGYSKLAQTIFDFGFRIHCLNVRWNEFGLSRFGLNHIERLHARLDDSESLAANPNIKHIMDLYDRSAPPTSSTRPRIAVCLSGEPRTYINCHQSLSHFLKNYSVDYFVHCWAHKAIPDIALAYPDAFICMDEIPDFTELERLGIRKMGVRDFGNGVKVPHASPNLYPMWYSIKRSYQAIKESGNDPLSYHAICRTRFDNYFPKTLDIEPIRENAIYVDPNYGGYGGYGDQFAVGRPTAMERYFGLYDSLANSFDWDFGDRKYHPESLVAVYLENVCGLTVVEAPIDSRLLRDEFVGLPPHKIPLRSHKASQARNKALSDYVKSKYPDLVQ